MINYCFNSYSNITIFLILLYHELFPVTEIIRMCLFLDNGADMLVLHLFFFLFVLNLCFWFRPDSCLDYRIAKERNGRSCWTTKSTGTANAPSPVQRSSPTCSSSVWTCWPGKGRVTILFLFNDDFSHLLPLLSNDNMFFSAIIF